MGCNYLSIPCVNSERPNDAHMRRSSIIGSDNGLSPARRQAIIWTNDGILLIVPLGTIHDDVIKWKHFPRDWPFVRGIHRSPMKSPHKGKRRGALMFSLICVWINDWVNNREAGDLRRYCANYDVIVMFSETLIEILAQRILNIQYNFHIRWLFSRRTHRRTVLPWGRDMMCLFNPKTDQSSTVVTTLLYVTSYQGFIMMHLLPYNTQ